MRELDGLVGCSLRLVVDDGHEKTGAELPDKTGVNEFGRYRYFCNSQGTESGGEPNKYL